MNPALIVLILAAVYLVASIKILREDERAVIFRLGRMHPVAKGPGLILLFAPIDRMVRLSAGAPGEAERLIGAIGMAFAGPVQTIFVPWETLSSGSSGNVQGAHPLQYWAASAPAPVGKARVKNVQGAKLILEPYSF